GPSSATATSKRAPRAAESRAIARPRPADAPVTTTTCSERRFLAMCEAFSPAWRRAETLVVWAHAKHRRAGDHPAPTRGPPALRREAPAGDRQVARDRDARVQGLGDGYQQTGAGAPADDPASRRDAGHDCPGIRPRERNRPLPPDEDAAAPASPRA